MTVNLARVALGNLLIFFGSGFMVDVNSSVD